MVDTMDKNNALAPAEIVILINNSDEIDANWSPPSTGVLPLFKLAGRSVELLLNQTARGSREKLIEGVRHRLGEPGEGRWHLHVASMRSPLQKLHREDLIKYSGRTIELKNADRLAELCDFDIAHFHLDSTVQSAMIS